MATDRGARRRRWARAALAVPVAGAALAAAGPSAGAAAQRWWEPLAFAGQRVVSVSAPSDGPLTVRVGSAAYISDERGQAFTPVAAGATPPASSQSVTAAGRTWAIRAGVVLTGAAGTALTPDPRAPHLGDGARYIAAPAATPGVVAAVGTDGHVWRRSQDGDWATAFVLLPGGGLSGVPPVTGLAAFTAPLSTAIYLGTDGDGVLISSNGGDDWIRAGAGLPDHVLGLVTRSRSGSLYAATDDGLWVHRLQAFPAPPAYHDAALSLRWLGIAAVALVSTLLAAAGLRIALRGRSP